MTRRTVFIAFLSSIALLAVGLLLFHGPLADLIGGRTAARGGPGSRGPGDARGDAPGPGAAGVGGGPSSKNGRVAAPRRVDGPIAGRHGGRRPDDAGTAPADRANDAAKPPTPGSPSGPASLLVAVDGADGLAAAGVEVTLVSGARRPSRTTDAEGVVVFGDLPAGAYTLLLDSADLPQLGGDRAVTLSPGEEREIHVVLAPVDREISGRVLDARGEPVPDAEVTITSIGLEPDALQPDAIRLLAASRDSRTSTDESGRFRLSGLTDGEYRLEITAPEGASARHDVMAPSEGIDLVVHDEKSIVAAGRVTSSGKPIAGAWILVSGQRGRARTGEAGDFRIELSLRGSPAEMVTFTARKEGYVDAETSFRLADLGQREDLAFEFELEPAGELAEVSGRLTDSTGTAVAGETVFLRSAETGLRYQGVSAADGSYRIDDVLTGVYRLWVYPRGGHRDEVIDTLDVRPGANRVDLVLEALGSGALSGTLVDADGDPVPRFTFTVRSTLSFASSVVGTTDDRGRFRLQSVPSGNLVLETRTIPRVRVHGIRLEDGGEATVRVPLGFGDRTLRGRVVSGAGRGVPGAHVSFTWSARADGLQSTLTHETVAGQDGRFEVEGLAPGSGLVNARARGFELARTGCTISATGPADTVELELRPSKTEQ